MKYLQLAQIVALLFVATLGFSTASAQEPGAPDRQVFDREFESSARIVTLRQLYKDQYEVYLVAKREHELNLAQHRKLQTLASLEVSVQRARAASEAMVAVVITHLDIVHLSLQETIGVDLQQKQTQLAELELIVQQLRVYQQELSQAQDKDTLAQQLTQFPPLHVQARSISERSRSLITYGKTQAVFDSALLVRQELDRTLAEQELSALKQAERDRAYRELETQQQLVHSQLRKVRDGIYSERPLTMQQVSAELSTSSTQLRRYLEYLRELARS